MLISLVHSLQEVHSSSPLNRDLPRRQRRLIRLNKLGEVNTSELHVMRQRDLLIAPLERGTRPLAPVTEGPEAPVGARRLGPRRLEGDGDGPAGGADREDGDHAAEGLHGCGAAAARCAA